MEVGQKVYLKSHRLRNIIVKEYFIKTIGRKYITVWDGKADWTEEQFHKDTLRQKTHYAPDLYLYFSMQDINDEEETNDLNRKIGDKFNSINRSGLSLDQLRRINAIIEEGRCDGET